MNGFLFPILFPIFSNSALSQLRKVELAMAEFIYQMYQARKAHGDKVILDDVTLSLIHI